MAKKRIKYSGKFKQPAVTSKKPSLVVISSVLAIVFIAYVGLMGLITSISSFNNPNAEIQASPGELASNSLGSMFSIAPINLGLAILFLIILIAIVGIVIILKYNRPKALRPMRNIKRRR